MFATEVEAFFIETKGVTDVGQLAEFRAILAPDELSQMHRFVRRENRHDYLVAHALLRLALSRFAPIRPQDWVFVKNNQGRPEISAPKQAQRLSFNLSHTDGLVACVVAEDRPVGIDVEGISKVTDGLAIADQFFTKSEVKWLLAGGPTEQQTRFFKLWTLKEAYLKARGVGLSLPLDGFEFDLEAEQQVKISFLQSLLDTPACWQFKQQLISVKYVLAVAASIPDQTPIRIRCNPFFG